MPLTPDDLLHDPQLPATAENLHVFVALLEQLYAQFVKDLDSPYADRMGADTVSPRVAARIGQIEDPAALDALLRLLGNRDVHCGGSAALQSIARMAEAVVPALERAFEGASSPAHRGRIGGALLVAGGQLPGPAEPEVAEGASSILAGALSRSTRAPHRDAPQTHEAQNVGWAQIEGLLPMAPLNRRARLQLLDWMAHLADPAALPALLAQQEIEEDEQVAGRILDVRDALGDDNAWELALQALEAGSRERRIGAIDVLRRHVRNGRARTVYDTLAQRPAAWRGVMVLASTWAGGSQFVATAGTEAFDALVAVLDDPPDDATLRSAIEKLGRMPDPRAADRLHRELETRAVEELAWLYAFQQLTSRKDPRAIDWARRTATHPSMRNASLRTRAQLGDETALDAVVEHIVAKPVRGAYLLSCLLFDHQKKPRSHRLLDAARLALAPGSEALEKLLEADAVYARVVLGALGSAIVPRLIDEVRDIGPRIDLAVSTLGRIGDARAIAPLAELLETARARRPERSGVRLNALWQALLALGDRDLLARAHDEAALLAPGYGEPWLDGDDLAAAFRKFGGSEDARRLREVIERTRARVSDAEWWVAFQVRALSEVADELEERDP